MARTCRWWNDWAAFTGFTPDSQADGGKDSLEAAQREVPKPGPIDNTDILLSDLKELKPNLREGEDYVLRCPETWNKLEGKSSHFLHMACTSLCLDTTLRLRLIFVF